MQTTRTAVNYEAKLKCVTQAHKTSIKTVRAASLSAS